MQSSGRICVNTRHSKAQQTSSWVRSRGNTQMMTISHLLSIPTQRWIAAQCFMRRTNWKRIISFLLWFERIKVTKKKTQQTIQWILSDPQSPVLYLSIQCASFEHANQMYLRTEFYEEDRLKCNSITSNSFQIIKLTNKWSFTNSKWSTIIGIVEWFCTRMHTPWVKINAHKFKQKYNEFQDHLKVWFCP